VRPGSKAPAKAPEEFAVRLSVGRIEMKAENEARVLVYAYNLAEKQRSGTPFPVLLSRQDGKWVVVVK
jgi:hypothetical protein